MKKNRILSLPLMLLGASTMAQTVSESEALDKALNFIASQQPQMARGAQANVQLTLAHKAAIQDETCYYVFNNEANGGFIIIGGDESAEEVLGYSENGKFDPDNLPDNFRWWLSTYEQSIHRAISAQKATGEAMQAPKHAKAAQPNIEPLLTTQWDQTYPFNRAIPGNEDKPYRWYTGCVTTAVAQIMKYYEWPEHGWKLHQYEGYVSPYYMYSVNFAEATYDWDNMLDSYEDDFTDEQMNAVAQLMYHIGVASEMKFGRGFTSGYTNKAVRAMRRNFGYKQGIEKTKNNYEGDWEELVYSELAAKRPVLYSGRTADDAGHTFVCDGYQDGKFHINWGWSGYCDGYFLLTSTDSETALQPGGSGSGGAEEDDAYDQKQSVFIGLEPDYDYNGGVTIASLSNQGMCFNGKDFELTLTLDNRSSDKVAASYALVFFDDENYEIGNIDLDVLNFQPNETGVRVVVTNPYNLDCLVESDKQLKAELINANIGWIPEDGCTLTLCTNLKIPYTLTDAEWGTICLPYDAEVPADVKAYTVTDVNGTSLVLSEATKLEMNKAYLLHGEPDTYQFHGPDTPQGIYQNGLLYGVTKKAGDYAPKGSYVLQNNPDTGLAFYKVTQDYRYRIKKYTAYLKAEIPAGARIFIDEESGIQNLEVDDAEAAEIFNVLGQRTASVKGLVIKNGKLNFVK